MSPLTRAGIWIYRTQYVLTTTLFFLIILGAGVRIGDAGLACPDWPLCFGKFVPPFDIKVFLEWIHRVIAMASGGMALIVAIGVFSLRALRGSLCIFVILSLILFGFQAWLGRQTVVELLTAETVAAHLMGGYTLYALNLIICCRLRKLYKGSSDTVVFAPISVKLIFPFLLLLIFVQATLGGTVSSHYAGLVCPDFPTCNGSWWPGFSGLIGLQFAHRILAFVLLFSVLAVIQRVSLVIMEQRVVRLLWIAFFLILFQIGFGITMIFTELHPLFSLLHSATAIGIFSSLMLGAIRVYDR